MVAPPTVPELAQRALAVFCVRRDPHIRWQMWMQSVIARTGIPVSRLDEPVPLVAPCITAHDRKYLNRRISGGLLHSESEVRWFEDSFAEQVGCKYAVAVSSGTAALQLALDALKVGTTTVPTFTCLAVRNACGNRTIKYRDSSFDIREQQLTMDGAVSVSTPAFGRPTLGEYLPPQIEDYTLSLGGLPGLRGILGVCSTHSSKMVSTGRGGVVFSNNVAPEYLRELVEERGIAMSATQAALGVSQLAQLDAFIERRRELASLYTERFTAAGIESPDPGCGSVFFRYIIAVQHPVDKVEQLAQVGIEAGRGVNPLLHRVAGLPDDRFPGAVTDWKRLLSVPCHPSITDRQARFIADKVVQLCSP